MKKSKLTNFYKMIKSSVKIRRSLAFVAFLHLVIILCSFAFFQKPGNDKGKLTFYAGNFSNNSGQACIYLYRSQDELTKPFLLKSCKIENGKATIIFEDIPYGEYAAFLFHDINSNNKPDHSMKNRELRGFSNSWKNSFFSWYPDFEDLKFTFSIEKTTYKINVE